MPCPVVTICSRPILSIDKANVSVRIEGYQRGEAGQTRVMTLSAVEFSRRFPRHILPCGFPRIRHYGFLAGSNRKVGLARIRAILGATILRRPTAIEPNTQHPPSTPERLPPTAASP